MATLQATNVSGLPLEVGKYDARIIGGEDAEPTGNSKFDKGVPRFMLKLRVTTGEGPIECRDYLTLYPRAGKKTKAYSCFSASLFGGAEIPEGADLDTDELINKRVQIVVIPKTDGNGNMIGKYEAVGGAKKPAPAPRVIAPDDDDDSDLANA